jgi:hypothetical protein
VKSPIRLWDQANEEYPDDKTARTKRYLELMREEGHIIKKQPGDNRPLFPCGYEPRKKQ